MNFLGIGGFEWLLIALVAFLVLGAKGMADGARTVRKVMNDLRSQGSELRTMVRDAINEDSAADGAKKAPVAPEGAVARSSGPRALEAEKQAAPDQDKDPAAAAPDAAPSASQAAGDAGPGPASPGSGAKRE
jgi:Sec-independent protein translocase protein TatA